MIRRHYPFRWGIVISDWLLRDNSVSWECWGYGNWIGILKNSIRNNTSKNLIKLINFSFSVDLSWRDTLTVAGGTFSLWCDWWTGSKQLTVNGHQASWLQVASGLWFAVSVRKMPVNLFISVSFKLGKKAQLYSLIKYCIRSFRAYKSFSNPQRLLVLFH